MSPSRRQQIEQIYHAALERGVGEREAFLREASGGDEDLLHQVESLLNQLETGVMDQDPWQVLVEQSLKPGDKLGPYQIVAKAGAGGMGTVYRALDTRLGRIVAIKVSSERFSARFDGEARAIAALNHPHICTLYDVGPNYLVMEFVEGRPLTAPLPLDEALRYAVQIAHALMAAHCKGIIHRDLKPANILISKAGVKLLDFGLAKMQAQNGNALPEFGLTAEGIIVGTRPYMSPEQAQGKPVDTRSDIFSFGAIVYELLTGRRAFEGENAAAVTAAVLTADPPPLTVVAPSVPAALEHAVRRCLAKDSDDRWQTARDLHAELLWIQDVGTVGAAGSIRRSFHATAAALGAVAALAAAAGAYWLWRPAIPPLPHRTLIVTSHETLGGPSISPDGHRVAYVSEHRLYIRDLSHAEPIEVPDAAAGPVEESLVPNLFWSPDSQWMGYTRRNEIRKTTAIGAASQPVCKAPGTVQGAAWTDAWDPHGTIVFAVNAGAIYRVSAEGGEPVQILEGSRTRTYDFHGIVFVGDGEEFMTWTHPKPNSPGNWIRISKRGEETRIVSTEPSIRGDAAWSRIGSLLTSNTTNGLWDIPIDSSGRLRDRDKTLIDSQGQMASESRDGSLAYLRRNLSDDQVVTVDRSGHVVQELQQPLPAVAAIGVSPNGRRAAIQSSTGLWIYDLPAGTVARLLNNVANPRMPRWSSDGKRIGFIGNSLGVDGGELYTQPVDSSAGPSSISITPPAEWDWSRDQDKIVYSTQQQGNQRDILMLTRSSGKTEGLATTRAFEQRPEIDPSGRYLAYESDETGRFEVYVRSFPGGSGRWLVSGAGGQFPRWSPRGDELFYLAGEVMMAVKVSGNNTFRVDQGPRKLFAADADGRMKISGYAPLPDGQKFLIPRSLGSQTRSIMLVENWRQKKDARP